MSMNQSQTVRRTDPKPFCPSTIWVLKKAAAITKCSKIPRLDRLLQCLMLFKLQQLMHTLGKSLTKIFLKKNTFNFLVNCHPKFRLDSESVFINWKLMTSDKRVAYDLNTSTYAWLICPVLFMIDALKKNSFIFRLKQLLFLTLAVRNGVPSRSFQPLHLK